MAPSIAQSAGKATSSVSVDVAPAQLVAQPVGKNWLSYNGDYTGRRYSSLDQIKVENVGQLRAQWVFHSPNPGGLEVTPVVVGGVMFVAVASGSDIFSFALP